MRNRVSPYAVLLGVLALLGISCPLLAATDPSAVDLDGQTVKLPSSGAPVVVLFFTASDCPIASRYEPEMLRLEQKFNPSNVAFWWVYPNPGDTAATIRRHREQFTGSAHVLRDVDQSLAHWSHATVTPEAAIFVSNSGSLREVYHGRIDDRYIALGREQPRATHHELEEAIGAALAKRPIPRPAGLPVGCALVPLGLERP